jgi:hypothetical protein
MLPVLAAAFRRHQRPVGKSWRMDETYLALLNFEWVDLPALGLASVADAACSRLDHNDQNV